MIRMLYSPEPKALARTDETGCNRNPFHGLLIRKERGAGVRRANPHRAQKANLSSMSRGLQTSLQKTFFNAPIGFAVVLGFAGICSVGTAHAQSAGKLDKRGANAELHEDYDTAYEDYRLAHQKNPKDLKIKAHLERMRFQAAVSHVDRGRVLRQSGDYSGALKEFMRASEIDPGNQTAQQEIGITQREQPAPTPIGPGATAAAAELTQQASVLQNIASISAPVVLKPVSNDPITLSRGGGRQEYLPVDRQTGGAECAVRSGVHVEAHSCRSDECDAERCAEDRGDDLRVRFTSR